MSDCEQRDSADVDIQSDAVADQEILPPDAQTPWEADSASPRGCLPAPIPSPPTRRAETIGELSCIRAASSSGRPRLVFAAAIAMTAVLIGGALLAVSEHRAQADMIARQAGQTEALTQTIDALDARLNVLESARSHDDLAEARRTIGEIRPSAASSRELSGAIAQLAERVDKLDQDAITKVDKPRERIDRQTKAPTAELAARVGKLEKKLAATVAANPPSPPSKPSVPPLNLTSNVSMETTGSIERARPVLKGYIVLGARDDVALIQGGDGERAVRRGDFLPGAGHVERIGRDGESWVVLTERGRIVAAAQPDERN